MLFSATSTQKIEDLTRLALKKEPITVGVDDVINEATVEGLEQGTLFLLNKPLTHLLKKCFAFSFYRLHCLSRREEVFDALLFPEAES